MLGGLFMLIFAQKYFCVNIAFLLLWDGQSDGKESTNFALLLFREIYEARKILTKVIQCIEFI